MVNGELLTGMAPSTGYLQIVDKTLHANTYHPIQIWSSF